MGYALPTDTDWVTCDWQAHIDRDSSEPGTDYGIAWGKPIYAPFNGVVTYVKTTNSGAMGRVVEYRLDDGRDGRTLHMQEVWVHVGQRIGRGQTLGLSGASGFNSDWYYGPHAHQTLWPGAAWSAPTIDFEPYVGSDTPAPPPGNMEDWDMPIVIVERADSSLPKGLLDPAKGRISREISKAENSVYRAGQHESQGGIVYAQVSDSDYEALLKG